MYSTIFDGKSCTWTHFVAFEMADKAKLSRTLLLTALYCIYMRRINFDSATVNISVLIKQRNISFQGQNDISQRAVRKVKESWAWTTWESKSNCWSLHHVYRLDGSKSFKSSKTIVLIWNIQSPHEDNLYRPIEATKSEHRKLWAQCKLNTSLSQGRLGTIDLSGNFVRVD